MSMVVSQITSFSIVCSIVCSGADQRKHQSSASLAFVRGIHRWPANSPHNELVTEIFSIWWRHHGKQLLLPGHTYMGRTIENFTIHSRVLTNERVKHPSYLNHYGLTTPYGDVVLINIGSGSGLLPDDTKPLNKPILSYQKWDPMTFIWGQFYTRKPSLQSLKLTLTLLI